MTPKQALEDWSEYIRSILEVTSIDINEPQHLRDSRRQSLEAETEQWFGYYFPKYVFAKPAQFHLDATERLLSRREHYEVRLWSRELAKSTRTMMEVLYLMLVGHPETEPGGGRLKKKYCLLMSNSFENATRLLAPYKLNLECNQRIIQDYGMQETTGKWQAAELTTGTGMSFRALGVGQSPRGTRNDEARPDILIFDDVDTDADCLNPDIVAKKWRWIEEAAIGTRSVSQPTTILFCGNKIAVDCCIDRATTFADFVDLRNIRDENLRSVWPEKNSEEHIERVIKQKSYAAWQKEYFNNPMVEGAIFKEMNWKPALPISEYAHLVCYTDPSYTATGDFKATVLVGLWKDEYHVIKAFVEQTTTAQLLQWHLEINQIVGPTTRCKYYMEEVFIQSNILAELNELKVKAGASFYLRGDKRKKYAKFMRIESLLEPLNRNGKLYLNATEKHNPHMDRLASQFKVFSANSTAHDDGPDAVEGAVWILGELSKPAMPGTISFGTERRDLRL